ncbi:hypothetical protein MAHJHV54_47720 [Mycobacterium avium subsp. hominissuis]
MPDSSTPESTGTDEGLTISGFDYEVSAEAQVAAKTTVSPEISTRIPVNMGKVSSRPAATTPCPC